MNVINIIGKSGYDKVNMMLYLAKCIREVKNEKIIIATKNPYYIGEFNPWDYITQISFFNFIEDKELEQLKYAGAAYVFIDSENVKLNDTFSELLVNSKNFIFTNQSKEVIEYNVKILESFKNKSIEIKTIAYRINEFSKIKIKLINELYSLVDNFTYSYYMNLKDDALLLDNSHNNSLRIRNMSKEYKNFLIELIIDILNIDSENKKDMRMIKREIGRVK
jgi:hypothetical protein